MKDYNYAIKASIENGIDFNEDFHALNSDAVDFLVELAKTFKYRKPKNANGSTARYFFTLLQRRAARDHRLTNARVRTS